MGIADTPFGLKTFFSYIDSQINLCLKPSSEKLFILEWQIFEDTQVDQQVAKKCLCLKVTNYTLRCNSEMSLRRPERSQRRLRGDVFNTSHRRRLWDLQISPLWDVSDTLHEKSQKCIWDASMLAGMKHSNIQCTSNSRINTLSVWENWIKKLRYQSIKKF